MASRPQLPELDYEAMPAEEILRALLEAFAGSNGGQTTAEYALLLGVITLPLILVLTEFGLTRVRLFEAIVRALMP